MKICVVSSVGGHLTEVRALRGVYEKFDYFYVLNSPIALPKDMLGRTIFIRHSERDLYFLVNLLEAWKILRKHKPTLILSTGAGPLVPFALVGKILGVPSIYIETLTRVIKPSWTGRIMYFLADKFFYQGKMLAAYFPRGTYGGPLL